MAESQNLRSNHEPTTSGEEEPSQTVGEGLRSVFSTAPHLPWRALLPREKVFLRFAKHWILQLRTGMPFVQNDILETMRTDSRVLLTWCNFMNMLLTCSNPATPNIMSLEMYENILPQPFIRSGAEAGNLRWEESAPLEQDWTHPSSLFDSWTPQAMLSFCVQP